MASDWNLFVGRTWFGRPVHYNIYAGPPHIVIAGATGSGKSEFLKLLLYSICQKRDASRMEIHIIDLKGGATFAAWKRAPQIHQVYRTTGQALECLLQVEETMWSRLDLIDNARYNFEKEPFMKEVFLVVDEGGEMSPEGAYGDEKKLRTACMQTLSTLVRIGREPRVHIVYATQRPDNDTLPTSIRSQLEARFCFRVREDLDSRIVLRHSGAELLPKIPGRMIMQLPDRELEVQSAYVPSDIVLNWLKSYKVEASVGLPSNLSTPVVTDEWSD